MSISYVNTGKVFGNVPILERESDLPRQIINGAMVFVVSEWSVSAEQLRAHLFIHVNNEWLKLRDKVTIPRSLIHVSGKFKLKFRFERKIEL